MTAEPWQILAARSLAKQRLEDIIRGKQAADRPQDRAVLPVLRRTLREKTKGEG